MNHKLIRKIAISGMKKNHKTLVPYLIAGIMTSMIFFILTSLGDCPYIYKNKVEAFYGASTISLFLQLGGYIVGIFAAIFMIYANSFVMKEKRREIGLYGILGLSKKNIATLLFFESIIYSGICILGGIITGSFLNKLMLLWLYKIIGQTPIKGFFFSGSALASTILLFLAIFGITLIINVSTISIGNPIDLIRSNKTGEKEPKVKWIIVIIGVVCLVAGYVISLKSGTAMSAIQNFFIAVILVIIGTYALFTAGSIFLLKILKSNKNYYYKTKHYISVSNLMYRMKHNAAGLASICVLSTGVIILLSCASSLMALGENNINKLFPMDVRVDATGYEKEVIYNELLEAAMDNSIDYTKSDVFVYETVTIQKTENGIKAIAEDEITNFDECAQVYIYTLEEYKNHFATDISLAENEILLYSSKDIKSEVFNISGKDFNIKGKVELNAIDATTLTSMSLFDAYYIVVDSENTLEKTYASLDTYGDGQARHIILAGINTKGDLSAEQIKGIQNSFAEYGEQAQVGFKQEDRVFFYNTYGGTFFVGIFLAVLFLMATVMIIYYKQMSEGLEDRKRFQILMNVGLTEKEVKGTIKSQVMILFFLPVVTSIIHMAFASNIVRNFLGMILIVDNATFIFAIAVVCVIFVIIYSIVYKITSVQYYKIVNGNE